MATTPEGKVKQAVKAVLTDYVIYGYWPVPGGYGAATLDYIGCINGWYFTIETKAPGKKPTPRQEQNITAIRRAGGIVFVIDGDPAQLAELRKFLDAATLRPRVLPGYIDRVAE